MSSTYKLHFKSRESSQQSTLVICLCISVLLNLFLSVQVISLKRKVKGGVSQAKLEAGTLAPPIVAQGPGGEAVSISYQENSLPTILYIFSPRCSWCDRNLDNAKALAAGTNGRYRFFALSLMDDDLQNYVAGRDINFLVYGGVSKQTRADYLLGSTPQTIVISADGRVQKNWTGAYDADTARQVEEYFQITLPGLYPPQQQANLPEGGK